MNKYNLPTAESPENIHKQLNLLRSLNLLLTREIEFIEKFENSLGSSFFEREAIDFYKELERFEINMIRVALIKSKGNQKEASYLLGINPQTFHAKVKRYKIEY